MQLSKAHSLLAVTLVTLSLPMASGLVAETGQGDSEWVDGPVRWLLLPAEWKALRQASRNNRSAEFIEEFWARRDPWPLKSGNQFRELFERRVEAADTLYTEGGVAGSLTDRGRAFILLGSPAHVKVTREPALAWSSQPGTTSRAASRTVAEEVWGFRLADLPEGLVDLAGQRKRGADETLSLTLTFRAGPDHTVLINGEALLNLAARAYVQRPLD